MKRYLIIIATLFLALASATPSFAQNNDSIVVISSPSVREDSVSATRPAPSRANAPRPDNFWRRVSVGGWLSFQFGTITGVSVSPEVKVRLVNQLYPGAGFIYQYAYYNDYYIDPVTNQPADFSSSIVGGRFFLRYYLSGIVDNFLGNFFAHTEYEYLSYVGHSENYGDEVYNISSIFVGGGYKQPVSDRAFFDFLLLFNLNDTPDSPYTNPIFRFGFGIGL